MNCKYKNHHYIVPLQNKIFFGHNQSLDFFHFILNPGQRRVFQLVLNKINIFVLNEEGFWLLYICTHYFTPRPTKCQVRDEAPNLGP
jgi:hypothetical protein